ncbi:cilia- and flagella-associated protein 54-like [Pocillopora damicornis]|nr:cilia- and flagella-associated protein 54-like [Pocillopora damicornis]
MELSTSGKSVVDLNTSFVGGNGRNGLQSNGTTNGDLKQISPVLVAFEQELSRFIKYIKKKSEPGLKTKKNDEEPLARGSNTLFSMWNTYESHLPQSYYQEKLLNTGDFLFFVKEYKLAQFHCYGRYLAKHVQRNLTLSETAELDADKFYKMHLPNGLDNLASATMVLRSALGEAICFYHVNTAEDPKLQALEFLLWACMCLESSVPLLTVKYLTWRSTLYTAVCQCYFDLKVPMHAEAFAKRGLGKVNELQEIEKMSTSEATPESEAAFRQAKTKMQVMIFKRVVFETRKRPKGLLRPKTKPNLKDFAHHAWPRTPTERLMTDLQGTAAKFLAILEALSETYRRTLHCEAPTPDAEDTAIDVCAELFFAGMEIIAGGGGIKQALKHDGVIHPSVWELQNTSIMELVAKGENGVPLPALVKFVKHAFSYEHWEPFGQLIEPTLQLLQEQSDINSLVDIKTLQLMLALEPFYNTVKKTKKTPAQADEGETGPHAHGRTGSPLEELTHLADVIQSCSEEPFKSAILMKDIDMMVDASLFLWSKCKPHFQRILSSSLENCKQLLNDVFFNRWLYILTVAHTALSWSNAALFDPILSAEVTLKFSLLLECKAGTTDNSRVGSTDILETPTIPVSPETVDNKQEKAEGESPEKPAMGPGSLRSLFTDVSQQMIVAMGGVSVGVREVLNKVLGILDQGLRDITKARDTVIDTRKRNIADISWIKEYTWVPVNCEGILTIYKAGNLRWSKGGWQTPIHVMPQKPGMNIGFFWSTCPQGLPSRVNKPKTEDGDAEHQDSDLLERMIETLHMELLFVRHRVAVKLVNLGQEPCEPKRSAKKQKEKPKTGAGSLHFSDAENKLLSECSRNPLSKAMLRMHMAGQAVTSQSHVGTERQTQLLKESQELIVKCQQQERKVSSWNRQTDDTSDNILPSDVPPAPLLVYRSSAVLVFKPAPFEPKTGEKVAWYRLFARSASGNNVKVRLNDYQLPGTGEEIPATADIKFFVRGLKADEKYMAAVAAYNEHGKLIGGSVGLTCRPILAAHPLPTLMAWGYLAQLSFASGVLSVAKSAASVLWNHFVKEREIYEENTNIQTASSDLCISLQRVDEDRLRECSPVLARLFLQSIFISVDIRIREGHLFCDCLCDSGSLYNGQVARLEECERLLLAIQVSGWLNDTALCLQAVVQCYGLLAPLIHQKIPAKPVVQVLLRCHAVLQEVPSLTRHRKSSSTSDSLSHMIATMTYYIAKILQMWNEQGVAGAIIELGKKMLNIETAPDSAGTMTTMQAAAAMATATLGGPPPSKTTKKKPGATKKPKGGGGKGLGKLEKEAAAFTADAQNEELKALEAYILKLSQQALNRDDEELTGSEDPSVLHSVVANLPAQQAYKEVLKFKRRTRFLGFYVQVLAKALQEGLTETALDWTNDTMTWIVRRNEMLLANKPTIVRQAAATAGPEEEKIKKFATAIVEFSKPPTRSPQKTRQGETKNEDKEETEIVVRNKQETASRPPQSQKKSVVPSTVSRKARRFKGRTAEEVDIFNAIERLQGFLPEYWRSSQRRKKLRAVSCEELPWRAQMGILLAGANFDLFLDKVESGQRLADVGDAENPLYRPSYMDPDWFGYATSGTLIVSWAGASRRASPEPPMGFSGSARDTPFSQRAPTGSRSHPREGTRTGSRVTGVTGSEGSTASKSPMFFLLSALDHLSRAIVLTYRGKYWIMLQNACRALWNMTQTVLMRVVAGTLHLAEDPLAEGSTDIDVLRKALWQKFYFGADRLLDMMVLIQEQAKTESEQNKKRDKVKRGDLLINEKQGLMGGVEDERGGASLLFEIPLDNSNVADTRWLKRFILYAVEMLFYERKWERAVSIILRFNALTRSRYAESVLPLLIVAQRKLHEQINDHGGPSGSQPLITVSKETGIAEEFFIKPSEYMSIEPAVHIDPEGHDVYRGSVDALRLVSVPLDVNKSLQALHQALELKHHTARSLDHSRQLLLCYLAGQQEGKRIRYASKCGTSTRVQRGSSRVGFLPSQVKPPTDVPLDLTKETFDSVEDVQTFTLQPSQLAVVIASYDKTIEMLQFRKQKSLAAQAMHELGNIMFHSGNIRAAYKWWAESLDTILNTADSLKTWRDLTSSSDTSLKPGAALLQRCGLWGCLLGGVLAANIAQYIHTSNLGLRLECCLLSATFFKALFCSSLPHPTAEKDYALYEVGAGCEVAELIPGIDLLSNAFRSNGRSVLAALRWITEELARARYLITVLPLITLCLYFSTHVARDLQRSVDIRILRVRVLTDLEMFSEAARVLTSLLRGEKLPKVSDGGFRTVENKTKPPPVFNNKESVMSAGNLAVLNYLLDHRLQPSLLVLYGPQLTGQLTIAHAHLMIAIAATVYAIPADCHQELTRYLEAKEEEEAALLELPVPPLPSQSPTGKKNPKKKSSDEVISLKSSQVAQRRKLIDPATITPELIKGFLLATAELILTNLCDSLSDAPDQASFEDEPLSMSSVDLEQVCLSRLELAEIASQRHHALTSGNIVYACMRALEDAAILNELDLEKRAPSLMSSQVRSAHSTVSGWGGDHYFHNQARSRLDARLWLTCRLTLAHGLAEEDSGMGKLGGSTRSVTSSIGTCLHHCRQGLDEAEAFGDIELMAEFSLLSVVQNLQQGKMGPDLLETLEKVVLSLEQSPALSFSGKQLLALTIVQHADIRPSGHISSTMSYLNDPLSAYTRAMTYLLEQLTQSGSDVNLVETSPVRPLHNIYFRQLLPLIDLKLRIGRTLTKQTHLSEHDRDSNVIPAEWQTAVRELELGLELARTAACQRKSIEAQLLLTLGQVQRQMLPSGQISPRTVVNTLVEAVQCTFISDHDLGLMKHAYLEMALVLISNANTLKPPKTPEQPPRPAESPTLGAKEGGRKISKKGSAKEKGKKEKETREKNKELDQEMRTNGRLLYACFRNILTVFNRNYCLIFLDLIDKSTKASDFEMCIQWFQPELDCVFVQDPADSQSERHRAVCVLYAFNNKALDLPANPLVGQVKAGLYHVIESRAQALHEKLMATLEKAENDLAPLQSSQTGPGNLEQNKGRPSKTDPAQLMVPGNLEQKPSGTGVTSRKKKSMGIRALSAKQRKDDHIRALLREHLSEIRALLQREVPVPVEEVPFEVNLQNVDCLEAMFDPSRGNLSKTTQAFYTWLSSLLEN